MYVCMYEICIYIHISIISAAVNYRAWQICGGFFLAKLINLIGLGNSSQQQMM